MDFQEAESKYFELKGRLNAGKLTEKQFQAQVAELRIQDDGGRYWTVDARSGGWLLYDGARWVPAQPPGSAAAPPAPPSAAPSGRRGGSSPVFLVGALAVAAVLCLVALGGAVIALGRLGGADGGGAGAGAVSQGQAERIADDLIAKEFPEMKGAEKTLGSFQNPAGTRFWMVTYRQDVQAEFEGVSYRIPNVVIVSVDQETGEPVVAVSG